MASESKKHWHCTTKFKEYLRNTNRPNTNSGMSEHANVSYFVTSLTNKALASHPAPAKLETCDP